MSSQATNNARFTKEAAEWDANTKHVESTSKAFAAVQEYVPAFKYGSSKDIDVLEIGCGTGLLSFQIAPHVRSLVGVDTADGMIAAFDTKLSALQNPNLTALNHLLLDADSAELQRACTSLLGDAAQTPHRFDLVVSHLTLHHIADMAGLFATLFACLKPGGMVALTDYEDFGKEAIRFHPGSKRAGVERHGIRKEEARRMLVDAGFEDARVEVAFVLGKVVDEEEGMEKVVGEMEFPFLMCAGVRR
ncbi:S-adenosyl-L-methionine-dependent methyltransferase [Phaeosphaeriaceae sp. PMI808]|nr:S-adenosyl-L-methionine-dependent methyltransferase [Phaeosphaeriaceae sp. PMI808]